MLLPILAAFPDVNKISPFIIGCYAGLKEPLDFDNFLNDFVIEANKLMENGVSMCRESKIVQLKFRIRIFICDRPATCKISGTVSHVSKHGCPNCEQIGRRVNNVTVYSREEFSARTNESFRQRVDSNHHRVQSVYGVERINGLDMVLQLCVDPMHTCHLGVTKKILEGMLGKLRKRGYTGLRLRKSDRIKASKFYFEIGKFIPREFARRPRSFDELTNFKATEFRLFDFYIGILVTM